MKDKLCPLVITKNDSYWLPYSLNSIRGYFKKIVMYDVDSRDGSKEILEFFKKEFEGDGMEVVLEHFPDMAPREQIALKNAQIAEAGMDYYFTLDSDEVYNENSLNFLKDEFPDFLASGRLYGIVRRVEVRHDLVTAHGVSSYVPHHRVYSFRHCGWKGTHPQEFAAIKQKPENEYKFSENVICYHFHGTYRSPMELSVPKRMDRKNKPTYTPGEIEKFDLFQRLPALTTSIKNFLPNPALVQLQRDLCL